MAALLIGSETRLTLTHSPLRVRVVKQGWVESKAAAALSRRCRQSFIDCPQ